jgi:surface protein
MTIKTALCTSLLLLSASIEAQECFTVNSELRNAVEVYLKNMTGEMDEVAFSLLEQKYGTPIGAWCTAELQNFSGIFSREFHPAGSGVEMFNENISGWVTSNATDMSFMFAGNTGFNQDISNWDTKNVVNFDNMFSDCTQFNQDIGSWNVEKAEIFSWMFRSASKFNQNLNSWVTTSLTKMNGMFQDASNFNGDISTWDVSKVEDFSYVFWRASSFNSNIGNWNVQSAMNMQRLFMEAISFNQDISGWKIDETSDMLHLFDGASSFNQDIGGWNVSASRNMANMFHQATSFNQDLSNWDVSQTQKHAKMFMDASSFDQDLCKWRNIMEYGESGQMFQGTACTYQKDPDPALKGPFCASNCGGVSDFHTPAPAPASPSAPTNDMPTSKIVTLEPISDNTKALIFGLMGALVLLVVTIMTTVCGEKAGSKKFELELHDRGGPDPNALPDNTSFVDVDWPFETPDESSNASEEDYSDDEDAPVIV